MDITFEDLQKNVNERASVVYDNIEKGRRSLPVGTVKDGRVKVAEGVWRPVGDAKKKRRLAEGQEKKPSKKDKPQNPFMGKTKAKLQENRKKLKQEQPKFSGDPEKIAKIKEALAQISQALKELGGGNDDKKK
jgi:hypothetical protein